MPRTTYVPITLAYFDARKDERVGSGELPVERDWLYQTDTGRQIDRSLVKQRIEQLKRDHQLPNAPLGVSDDDLVIVASHHEMFPVYAPNVHVDSVQKI